ncbi:reticulon-1-like [Paramacrobiotus metropolitanus]|uniref:reticulon-1-like n=1 Tax=Paramacrobiotus metropolitanus TaxID=2943436 RepID=UPI0024459872|nr:reticulon-1-like [Paramacrobiotus metropolitanus]
MESHEVKEFVHPDGTYLREENHTEKPQETTETFVRTHDAAVEEPENKENSLDLKTDGSFASTGDASLNYSGFVRDLAEKNRDGNYNQSPDMSKLNMLQQETQIYSSDNLNIHCCHERRWIVWRHWSQQRTPFEYSEGNVSVAGREERNEKDDWPKLPAVKGSALHADAPSFVPLAQTVHRPDQLSRTTLGQPHLDSPMAEFDVDRRRTNSHGNIRTRRARPLSQHVGDLIMWRNTKDSAVIFTFGTILLLSLSYFSLISIFAYLSMITLMVITTFVLMRQVTSAFQQQTSEHPFRGVIGKDVVISPEYAHQQLDSILKPLNNTLVKVRNLYLADSLGQTLKLTFIMYLLTYVGSWFNLLTLLTVVWIGAFSIPKLYEANKEQIDSVLDVILEGLRDVRRQVMRAANHQLAKIRPGARRVNSTKRENLAGKIRTQPEVASKLE